MRRIKAGRAFQARSAFVCLSLCVLPLHAQQAPVLRWWQGAVVVGGIAAAGLFDEGVQHSMQEARSPTSDGVARVARRMGQPEVYLVAPAALLLSGWIEHRPALRSAGGRIAGSLLVAGVLTGATKFTVGRLRPFESEEPYRVKPFSGSDAFPSGHTSMAFALATSLADEIHHTWASALLFSAATATGWSRLNDNKHWLTDVLAGAALGIASAQVVERRWRLRATPTRRGVAFQLAF